MYLKKDITYKKNAEGEWVAYIGKETLATAARKADCEAMAKKAVEELNAALEAEPEPEAEQEVKAAVIEVEAEAVVECEEAYNLSHKHDEVHEALKSGEELVLLVADTLFGCRQTDSGMFSITELVSGKTEVVPFPKYYGIGIRDAFGLPTNKKHVRK